MEVSAIDGSVQGYDGAGERVLDIVDGPSVISMASSDPEPSRGFTVSVLLHSPNLALFDTGNGLLFSSATTVRRFLEAMFVATIDTLAECAGG